MIKSHKFKSFFSGISFSMQSAVKENRWKIVLSCLLAIAGIIFGVVVAVKTDVYGSFKAIQEINVSGFEKGFVASSSAFLSRTFSLLFNILLLTLCSFTVFTMPLAHLLLAYRAYLFGLNFALIFVFYGLGPMITAIVVILPCQLLTLFCLVSFYILLSKTNSNCKKYGSTESNRFLIILFGFLLVFLINLIETILLVLLNGKVILII